MNPLLLSALLSFGPAALGGLFGDPKADLRKKLMHLLSTANVGNTTNKFYQQAISSPAYSQAQGTIAAGANQTANQLAAATGARGIGTSGAGALMNSITPSIVGSQQAGLRTSAYNQAGQQAQQSIQDQIAALTGTSGPSRGAQLFAGGMDAFGPLLQAFLKTKYPNFFGASPASATR